MNTRIDVVGEYEIRQYGCCGTYFFMVAIAATRKRCVMSLKSKEEAYAWIDRQKELPDSQENVIFAQEVKNGTEV